MQTTLYLLDTDIVTLFLAGDQTVVARVLRQPPTQIFISVVTVEDILRGRLDYIRQAESRKNREAMMRGYTLLQDSLDALNRFNVLPFDEVASTQYAAFDAAARRAGAQDAKIAAIALSCGGTVVTRNLRHFACFAGVVQEDWAQTISD